MNTVSYKNRRGRLFDPFFFLLSTFFLLFFSFFFPLIFKTVFPQADTKI